MTTTIVLINPFTASGRDINGLLANKGLTANDKKVGTNLVPSVDVVRSITERGHRVVILDNRLDTKLAKSVVPFYYGAQEVAELKAEARLNFNLVLVNANVNYYDWHLPGRNDGDIRETADRIVYVDYSKYYALPPNLNDELVVMSTVEDFKTEGRKYVRDVPAEGLLDLLESLTATPWCDPDNCPDIRSNFSYYEPLLRSLRFYVANGFHNDEPQLPFGMMETNIIKEEETKSYSFVMSQPIFKCFIATNNLGPPVPKYDRIAYVGTGKSSTVLMTISGQYRRLITEEVGAFFRIALTRQGVEVPDEILDVKFLDKLIEDMSGSGR